MQMKIIGDLLKTASQNEKFKKGAVIGGIGAVGTVAGTLMLKVIQHQKEKYGEDGYNGYGYDKDGYNREGYNRNGLDREGYGQDGYDREGYNRNGLDREGYGRDGYDREGYNLEGYNAEGYDREGYNADGYDCEGYSRSGYNIKGFDRQGYDRNFDTKQDVLRWLRKTLKRVEGADASLKAGEYEGAASKVRNVIEDICGILLKHYRGFVKSSTLENKISACRYSEYIPYEMGNQLHTARIQCNEVVHTTRGNAVEGTWRVENSITIVKKVIQYLYDDFQKNG